MNTADYLSCMHWVLSATETRRDKYQDPVQKTFTKTSEIPEDELLQFVWVYENEHERTSEDKGVK